MKSTTASKRVLLLTNSEHGQANVFLATSYALLTLEDEDVEVHFASFDPIKSFVSATSNHAKLDKPAARPIVFHTINGVDMVSAWTRPEITAEQEALKNRSIIPLLHIIRRTLVLLKVTLPWTGPEFVQIMHSVADIVQDVEPDIIAVDPCFSPALTVLRHLRARFIILSPNTIKDFAIPVQPNAEALWKYPSLGTYYPYPLPARAIPHNTLLIILSLLVTIFDPTRRALTHYLTTHYHPTVRLTTLATLSLKPSAINPPGNTNTNTNHTAPPIFLVANLPQLEFPLRVLPSHIIPCGPMLRPARPVGEVDAGLAGWLAAAAAVVYVNLGTHVFYDGERAGEMARAVKRLLVATSSSSEEEEEATAGAAAAGGAKGKGKGVRVLWKIPKRGRELEVGLGGEGREWVFGAGGVVERVLGEEVEMGVVRVVDWLEAEPMAVLESGVVVCAVHHGGANSFLEAVCAGVPQVVLPVWMDTFDFARRTELLGIGRWGNRLARKLCEEKELGAVLTEVVAGEKSLAYAQKAKELAELCKASGGGRVIAARHILAQIGFDYDSSPSEGGKETDALLSPHN